MIASTILSHPRIGQQGPSHLLDQIAQLDQKLLEHFSNAMLIEPAFSRVIVSFQGSKNEPSYRWYKYKEAFSPSLVNYLIQRYDVKGVVLDPFAGSGTALFAASEAGLSTDGIELLPIGHEIIKARRHLGPKSSGSERDTLVRWLVERPWEKSEIASSLPTLRITKGAYPPETADAIERYLGALCLEAPLERSIMRFVLLCVLEAVSYTRKDGQYLRWDYRSGRMVGKKPVYKSVIRDLSNAIIDKIDEILLDVSSTTSPDSSRPIGRLRGIVRLMEGSCLDWLPQLPQESYNAIITSPPYCNRYDYTRTYALELALLGLDEKQVAGLRQQMLSCTVENRQKDLVALNPVWSTVIDIVDHQELLQTVLLYLEQQKIHRLLNNNGIPRMVRGYFYEMACVAVECHRVLTLGGRVFMVNDNVRYAGVSIPVDTILSSIAEAIGFEVENIFVLPVGKGNSSQQMGVHGRDVLRKCVYVWRKV